jgi:hypothetical protein
MGSERLSELGEKLRKMGDEQGAFMNDRVLDVVVAWGHLGVS